MERAYLEIHEGWRNPDERQTTNDSASSEADVDRDGRLEILVCTRDGYLKVYR
jgi:hypothetical protein